MKIQVAFQWKSRTIIEEVNWFEDESDPSLNSDPYQTAAFIVHKHFPGKPECCVLHRVTGTLSTINCSLRLIFLSLPGERDTAKARQIVFNSLVRKTKYSIATATQTRPETEGSVSMFQTSIIHNNASPDKAQEVSLMCTVINPPL